MKIYLSPVRMDMQLVASVAGDTITVNGNVLDFTPLLEGETLPSTAILNDWIVGVASPESDALSGLKSLQSALFFMTLVIMILGVLWPELEIKVYS